MKEAVRERNTIECERFAEQNGFTGAVGGHFPDLPYPPMPTFKPELPASVLRQTALPRRARVADRMEFFDSTSRSHNDV